jgi:sugar phosphate isomerase/epimerase
MRLSISNISWTEDYDTKVYACMKRYGFSGLEIAPTRIFPEQPYEHLSHAAEWAENLKGQHGFTVPSMQSIWYGRQEKLFGTAEERKALIDYTKNAIDFAAAIQCNNLVFGCPGNRNVPDGGKTDLAIPFFKELGEYAVRQGTVIGMEANPSIYNTNYVNDTEAALKLIQEVGSDGFRLNLDVGTMIYNEESVDILRGNVKFINHVHISEPGLKPIEKRALHKDLKNILAQESYQGFISVEMGKTDNMTILENVMSYISAVFDNE